MKTKRILLLIIALTSLGLSSCLDLINCVDGNNRLTSENRNINSFSGIISQGSLKVEITQGTTNEVIVEAESNLQDLIKTRVFGGNLVIETRNKCIDNNLPIVVKVTVVDIHRIELDGSGLIISDQLNTNNLDVYLSGSGMINLNVLSESIDARVSGSGQILMSGEANRTDLNISGSGNIRAEQLIQNICEAKISGSGNIYVNVQETLDVRISGSGSVHYFGNPTVNKSISGSGRVVKI